MDTSIHLFLVTGKAQYKASDTHEKWFSAWKSGTYLQTNQRVENVVFLLHKHQKQPSEKHQYYFHVYRKDVTFWEILYELPVACPSSVSRFVT